MRLISAGSLVRAQSGPFLFVNVDALAFTADSDRWSKLEIYKRDRPGCRKEFERQKCTNVCRNLNAGRLQSQAINKLITFLRGRQEQRNENEHDRTGRSQKFARDVMETK